VILVLRLIGLGLQDFENQIGFRIQSVMASSPNLPFAQFLGISAVLVTWALLIFILGLPYFVFSESSRRQTTIGKSFFGLHVVTLDNEKVSAFRAALRYLSKGLWLVPLGISFAVLPLIATASYSSHVVLFALGASFIIWCTTFGCTLISEERQGVHDLISDTLVRKHISLPFGRVVWGIGFTILLVGLVSFVHDEKSPRTRLEQQIAAFTRQGSVDGVATLPYNTRLNPSISDPNEKEPRPGIPSIPQISAAVNGVVVDFKESLAVYDLETGIFQVGFFRTELSPVDIEELRRASSMATNRGRKPDLAITMQFAAGENSCDIKELQGYVVSFQREAGSFNFAGASPLMEFSRLQTWRNSEEIVGLSCRACDPKVEGCKGGSFSGIFRDKDGTGTKNSQFSWDLAFRTRAYPKLTAGDGKVLNPNG